MLLRRHNNDGFGFDADKWTRIEDDAPLPTEGALIISATRWLEERESLAKRNDPVGVWLAGDDDLEAIGAQCRDLPLIALQFPRFQDGRAYSQARLLRERYGFSGELRAAGNVLRDQLAFMERCGFDAFELDERVGLEDFTQALGEISVWYQPAGDARIPAYRLRVGAAGDMETSVA